MTVASFSSFGDSLSFLFLLMSLFVETIEGALEILAGLGQLVSLKKPPLLDY